MKTIINTSEIPLSGDRETEHSLPRKLGANHSDTAARPRKHHNNFKQSCDLREDRGVRQLKSNPKNKP